MYDIARSSHPYGIHENLERNLGEQFAVSPGEQVINAINSWKYCKVICQLEAIGCVSGVTHFKNEINKVYSSHECWLKWW